MLVFLLTLNLLRTVYFFYIYVMLDSNTLQYFYQKKKKNIYIYIL